MTELSRQAIQRYKDMYPPGTGMLYFKWGISFMEPYLLPDRITRQVSYMERDTLIREVETKYPQKRNEPVSPYEEEYEDYSEVEPPNIKTGGM